MLLPLCRPSESTAIKGEMVELTDFSTLFPLLSFRPFLHDLLIPFHSIHVRCLPSSRALSPSSRRPVPVPPHKRSHPPPPPLQPRQRSPLPPSPDRAPSPGNHLCLLGPLLPTATDRPRHPGMGLHSFTSSTSTSRQSPSPPSRTRLSSSKRKRRRSLADPSGLRTRSQSLSPSARRR